MTRALAILLAAGCDALLGGPPPADQTLDAPIDGLTGAQLAVFAAGDEQFGRVFAPADGLGPLFNQSACAACHPGDGRGHPSTNLTRFGRDGDPFDYLLSLGGPQLQDRSIPGYPPETLPAEATARSVRGGPLVAGLGLVEAIPAEAILALADPDDRDGDGVSGRPNGLRGAFGRLGRFGRKATAVDLLQQVVSAYRNDMGLTTAQLPEDPVHPSLGAGDAVADPEVPAGTVEHVVFYLRTLAPPPRRNESDPTVRRGETLFGEIGCAACHVPELRTGASPIAPLQNRAVRLYSDLLLHDLGPALADGFPEGDATGSEWRTTPLWGLGAIATPLGGTPRYLHDGRTTRLDDAIALHGGEAEAARDHFLRLSSVEREALLAFLGSL